MESLLGYEGIAQPEGFSLLDYRLIEERAYSMDELDQDPDPVSTLFRLEKSRNLGELREGVRRLLQTLPGTENDRLREAFATWLTTVLIPVKEPGAEIPEVRDLTEVDSMLQQSVMQWRDGWFEDGWKKGLEEGRQEGRQVGRQEGRQEGWLQGREKGQEEGQRKGEAMLLLRQAEKKFGAVPTHLRDRIESASSRQLLEWSERILTAERIDQVFVD